MQPLIETVPQVTSYESILKTLDSLLPSHLKNPKVGIVCGSGLSTLADSLRDTVFVPYEKIEGFGRSTVPGHKSVLAFGLLSSRNVPVVAMLGRLHPYEGHPLSTVVYPIRVMAKMGVENIIITNASGSLNPKIPVGTIVTIQDHLALPNMTGPLNPLLGPPTSPNHMRFLPLSNAYSTRLRRLAFLSAHNLSKSPNPSHSALGVDINSLAEGTYAWVSGPTYETPAEGRFLRNAGADVVGMSTVPEVVAAREEGMQVLVLSLVTNFVVIPETCRSVKDEVAAELKGKKIELKAEPTVSHDEVLAIGKQKANVMRHLVEGIVELL